MPLPCHGHVIAAVANCSEEELAQLVGVEASSLAAWLATQFRGDDDARARWEARLGEMARQWWGS